MMGTPWAIASSYAAAIAAQPASPDAPPCTRGSEAKATAPVPSIRPTPAIAPAPVSGVITFSVPVSNSASSRIIGSRGRAAPASAGRAAWAGPAVTGPARSLSTTVT